MSGLLAVIIGVALCATLFGIAVRVKRVVPKILRWLTCACRGHNTVPLKRIDYAAFIVTCMHCGNVYLKTREPGGATFFHRYRGQFDILDDYAEEQAEAEPKFVDRDGMNT